jgi:predicted transcriptional regulator of viral defense system
MPSRTPRNALHRLHALALQRGGYFTAKQAAKLGYGYPHLTYHTRAGNIERVGHGIYRLRSIPIPDHADLIHLALWSRNRADEPQAVASHATALVLHELTGLLPRKVHLTVPPRFQKVPPRGTILHKARLAESDVEEREGFLLTTPLRTLLDAAASDDIPQDELTQAIRTALERGLVRRSALEQSARRAQGQERIERALARTRSRAR